MTSASKIKIVPFQDELIPEIAAVHFAAFKGYMSTRLGSRYVREFLTWFMKAEEGIGLVARGPDGRILGYAAGAPIHCRKEMNRDLVKVSAGGILLRPWLFFNSQFRQVVRARLSILLGSGSSRKKHETVLPPPVMSLVGIGVSPSARGKRAGSRLLSAFEARSRELQMASIQLSVYRRNKAARRLYERYGWKLAAGADSRRDETLYYYKLLQTNGNSR